MAGHYYYDPRPFYGHNNHTGLMPLDELFYGRYEPAVPYWQDQRMAPLSMFEDNYYGGPGLKQQMVRRPEIMHQQYVPQRGENNFMPHARPELVRDDMYTDMYRRSPYNFNYNNYGRDGVAVAPGMHPEILRQQQPVPRQSQDDTWVHTMSAPPPFGHGHQSFRGLPEPPPGAMAPRAAFGNGNGIGTGTGIDQYRPMSNGNDQYQMPVNNQNQNQSSHNNNSNSNSHGNGNSIGSKQSLGVSSQQNGSFGTQGKSLSQGGKSGVMQTSTMSKQLTGGGNNNNNNNNHSNSNAKRYNNDSSSSDSENDDDEYHNNGGKWSTVKSGTKHGHSGSATSAHGHKVDSHSHGYQSNSKNSSVSMSSKKSSGLSHGSYGNSTPGKHSSGGKHSSSQSKISKLLRFRDDSSSSEDDDESYGHGHSKKGSSKGSHQAHSSHVPIFQPNSYASQPKQMQFSSQSKSVELKVPICCDNCERKVRSCLEKMEGVESVLCDQWNRKVIVYGNLKAENVLKRVRRVKKTSELWQQAKQLQQQQQQLQQLRLY